MSNEPFNLDRHAAQYAQKIVAEAKACEIKKPVDTLERLVTKTLGVLQEQGVYAMILFLSSRTSDEKKVAPIIRKHLLDILCGANDASNSYGIPGFEEKETPSEDVNKVLEFFSEHVLNDMDKLLLVRDLYEQTLIYARFGAKAEDWS